MDKEQAIAQLDEYGYVVLPGAMTRDQAEQLRQRSAELIDQERPSGENVYLDGKSQRVWNLVNKGRIFEDMIQLPQVLELQEYLLGDDCTLSSFTVNLIGPGSPTGALHIDTPLGAVPKPLPDFAFCANTVYVLDDFTPDNGATWLVPKSCKRGYGPEAGSMPDSLAGGIQLEAQQGDIAVFHGATWHASGANRTDRERMILLGFFCRSFMKPQQDNYRLARPEVIERATPTLKRLLGFDSQSGLRT